jgi:uncharacterized repeat protein (TIGR01451 family)
MAFSFNLRTLTALLAALSFAGARAEAQGFGLSVTCSTSSILVGNPVTYTINVTNLTGVALLDAMVTNTLPSSVQILNVTNSQGSDSINSSVVSFDLGEFINGGIAQLVVVAKPTAAGFITNTVMVASVSVTNTIATNVVVQVTNLVIQADLGVTIAGPVQAVISNDWMTYGVSVTNAGPDAAPNVILTNTLPPGVIFKGVTPADAYTTAGSNLIFSFGTLANGGAANLRFVIQPTNAGSITLSASIGAASVLDTNIANNLTSTNITVTGYLPGTLVAVTNSAQTINLQNGLTEQFISLSNIGATSVPAARVVVTGLTNPLFNAVGTNNGSPFVYYSASLAAGQSANLLLQYNPRGFFPFTNGQLHAFAVPLPNWTPPKATGTSTNINIAGIFKLANGNRLIEFPSTEGQSYTIVYSDNVLFSNAMIAPPSIVAPANEMQWIDYGPPTTVSAPTNSSARFYRVFQNP